MAVRSNRHWNDPALGAAFSNLAQAFGPPDSGDIVNYANANAKREEASRLATLFDYSTSPDYDQTQFDRMGIAAGRYHPDQSYYSVDQGNATQRYGYDTQASTSRANNSADNDRALTEAAMRQASDPVAQGAIRPGFNPRDFGARGPAVPEFAGSVAPLSETQYNAQQQERLRQAGQITDQMIVDRTMGDATPVQAMGPDGKPRFMGGAEAARTGATPAPSGDKMPAYDNYIIAGENGDQVPSLGRVLPDGKIVTPAGEDITGRIIRKAGVGGNGMDIETGPNGELRIRTGDAAGNTISTTTDMQKQRAEANRTVSELTSLYSTLRPDDLGVSGNVNEALTDYGAQVAPGLARPDVAATRAQLKATILASAKALVNDGKLSNQDREAANAVMASAGLDESLSGAQAKIATLIAITAYRAKFADNVLAGGEPLPPLDGAMLGRLVDEKAISPAIADNYAKNVLRHKPQAPNGIIPGVVAPNVEAPADGVPTIASPDEALKLPSGAQFRTPDGRLKVRP